MFCRVEVMEREFDEIDRCGGWLSAYQDIKLLSKEFPFRMAKKPENSTRNRYRDVSPYDHSRVRLHRGDNDYINASLVPVADAGRRYILTQGPLPGTCGHFWQMVWEQESRAIIMLNRTVEKGSVKCAQYWPAGRDSDMCFMDTGFRVTLASEEQTASYTLRKLDLENTTLNEKKEILHFHYTAWPDFGVPESPAAFLCFLFRVCESGSLRARHGPAVVHCSAGIGRSGTFALVDSCLVLMELGLEGDDLDVRQVLLAMRKHRMGLIQTADQLRFSFLAIREGRKLILGLRPKEQNESIRGTDVGNKVRVDDVIEPSEPPPCPAKRLPDYPVCRMREQECHAVKSNGGDEQLESKTLTTEGLVNVDGHECRETTLRPSLSEAAALRRRARQQRVAATAERVAAMKRRQVEAERAAEAGWRGRWGPPLIRVSLIMAIAAGLFVGYRMFASNAEPKNFQ